MICPELASRRKIPLDIVGKEVGEAYAVIWVGVRVRGMGKRELVGLRGLGKGASEIEVGWDFLGGSGSSIFGVTSKPLLCFASCHTQLQPTL